jgi:ribonuclease J
VNPGARDFWFLPLGGTGEIGMNLNLYGHDGSWLMVDCGVTFARGDPRLPPVILPDPTFIAARREALCGLLVTHAHEDHVGAVAALWRQLRCPVYATPFTLAVLRRKLAEAGLEGRVPLHETHAGMRHAVGPFDIEWVGLTHSIPEPNALVINTPRGRVVHTGDWKLDDDPVIGHGYARERLRAIGDEGVDAMVCDSTNALLEGWSQSEAACHGPLLEAVRKAPGRVVVGCFASNIARLHTLARIARDSRREFVLLGRSLGNLVQAARLSGHWDPAVQPLAADLAAYLPPAQLLAVATGSQGEARAALDRLAADSHPDLRLAPGDTVIFSSRIIPGNEREVERLIRRLERLGVTVIEGQERGMHASGHPAREELRCLYDWLRPRLLIPTHGEPAHLLAQAQWARQCGVPHVLTGRNGDLFRIAPQPSVQRAVATVGVLGLIDGRAVTLGAPAASPAASEGIAARGGAVP